MSPVRFESTVQKFRYGVQVSGKSDREDPLPPLESAELMLGKRGDPSVHVRLRTREDRARPTLHMCAPHMSHSVFRHRLVAMLCV